MLTFKLFDPLCYAEMSGFQTLSKAPGSTGTVVVIETKTTATETTVATAATTLLLHVAWLGDSKAVLSSTNGTVVELSLDHRGTNPVEAERIINVGGFITSKGYVNGSLQISRSFGDPGLKSHFLNVCAPIKYHALVHALTPKGRTSPNERLTLETKETIEWKKSVKKIELEDAFKINCEGEKKEEEQKEEIIFAKDAVINLPGYICRVLHPEDEFVLVASDGLWDVLQPDECVRLVRFYISGEKELTLDQVAAKVVDAAVQRGTPDNTTLLIVRVN